MIHPNQPVHQTRRRGAAVLLCTLAAAVLSLATMAILRASVLQHRRTASKRQVASVQWANARQEARVTAVANAAELAGTTDPNLILTAVLAELRGEFPDVRGNVVTDGQGISSLVVYLQRTSSVPDVVFALD